jgi:hypothetical protein
MHPRVRAPSASAVKRNAGESDVNHRNAGFARTAYIGRYR